MKNIISICGENAGKIWTTLNRYGPMDRKNIIKETKLLENEFYAAIGWLARENKIYKDGQLYELKESNLTRKIGEDAGKIWELLYNQGKYNISNIAKNTNIKIHDAYSALGWLAREDKINTSVEKQIKYVNK